MTVEPPRLSTGQAAFIGVGSMVGAGIFSQVGGRGRGGVQRPGRLGAQKRDDPTVRSDLGWVDGYSEQHGAQE